jgi:hypothetical protein
MTRHVGRKYGWLAILALAMTITQAPLRGLAQSTSESPANQQHAATKVLNGPTSEPWPWHEKIAWSLGLALDIAGIIGLFFAVGTLKKLERQTKAGEESARAALDSARAVINSERAWVLVEELLPPKDLVPNSPFTGEALEREALRRLATDPEYLRANLTDQWELAMLKREEIRAEASALAGIWVLMMGFRFKIFGNTPAKLTASSLIFRLVDGRAKGNDTEPDLPDEPDYGTPSKPEEIPDMGSVLAPGFRFTVGVTLREGKLLPKEIVDIQQRRKFLCAYGFFRYRDSFEGTPDRETRFCYIYDVTRGGGVLIDPTTQLPVSPSAFRAGGPSAYNRAK